MESSSKHPGDFSKRFGKKRIRADEKDDKPSHRPFSGHVQQVDNSQNDWADKLRPSKISSGTPITRTVSLAVPSSFVRNAQTRELKTYLVGQIARCCAIYEIDEVVVFVDTGAELAGDPDKGPAVFTCRLLQYLETPSYLRKALFPFHHDLQFAGLLPTLDCPHHMRKSDISMYREGVVVESEIKDGSLVNIGLPQEAKITQLLQPGVRVTIQITDKRAPGAKAKNVAGEAVAPSKPRRSHGIYWGYQTRLARSFNEALSSCPFEGGYDLKIGHSPNGPPLLNDREFRLPAFTHGIIVFGGTDGIESCVEADETIKTSAARASTLFDLWADMCPSQGSRVVRTEEAVLASLAQLRPLISQLDS